MADHVYPEDPGTGASDGDWSDAANLAQLAYAVGHRNYVVTGLVFSNISGTSVDISQGVAVVTDASATAKNTSETRDSVAYVAEADARTGVSLTDNTINYVFLDIDLTADDTISYVVNTTDSAPTEPSLKIGTVDTNDNTATTLNRFATPVLVQDSGTDVEYAGVLDFDSNLSVTGDGDGTVNVDASGSGGGVSGPSQVQHFSYEAELSQQEIGRIAILSGEQFELHRLSCPMLNGSTDTSVTLDVYDTGANTVLASVNGGGTQTGSPIAAGGDGNDVIVRMTNNNSTSIFASPNWEAQII